MRDNGNRRRRATLWSGLYLGFFGGRDTDDETTE